MKRRHLEVRIPFLLSPCETHTATQTYIPGHRQSSLLRSKGSSTLKPRLAGSASPAQSSGPHPDLVPELLGLLSQLLQLTHGAGPVGRGWGRLGAAGRGLGEAAPGRWPEAWEGGCKADVRPQDRPGSSRERRGESPWPGRGQLGRGSRGRGTRGRNGVSGTQETLPKNRRLPQSSSRAPGNRVGSARGRAGETPPSDSSPGGTLGRQELGMGGGGSPFENRPGVRPSPHKAPPSQHLILKRGGASLNSPPHPHTAHPPHTPPAKTEVVMGGGLRGEARLFVGLPRQPSPGLRAPHW